MKRKLNSFLSILFGITIMFQSVYVLAENVYIDNSANFWTPIWFNWVVNSIVGQSDWKIIIWWDFTKYQWKEANKIIRLNSDWSRDYSFDIWDGFNWPINSMAIQSDGKIIVWWGFPQYKWYDTSGIIRLNSDGSRDTSFNVWDGLNGWIFSLALQSDWKIIIAWRFTNYNWTNANYLLRLNSNWSIDSSFNIWSGFDSPPKSIVIQSSGKIIIWWTFSEYKWTTANSIVRLNSDGSIDNTFNIGNGFNWAVESIVIQNNGKILAGWWFTIYNWAEFNRIIRLNTDGTVDNDFDIGEWFNSNAIYSLALQSDGKIVVWWTFWQYQWEYATYLVRLNSDGSRDDDFLGRWMNDAVFSIYIQNNWSILVWWYFSAYEWTEANNIVRILANWKRDISFDTYNGINGYSVNTMAIQSNGYLIVWWQFSSYKWQLLNNFFRMSPNWSIDTTFNVGSWFDNLNWDSVETIALQSDWKVLVAWYLTSYKWTPIGDLVRLNSNWSLDSNFDIGDGFENDEYPNVISIQPDGKILLWGYMNSYQWEPVSKIIRINSNWSLDSSFDIWNGFDADDSISAITLQPDWKILVW